MQWAHGSVGRLHISCFTIFVAFPSISPALRSATSALTCLDTGLVTTGGRGAPLQKGGLALARCARSVGSISSRLGSGTGAST